MKRKSTIGATRKKRMTPDEGDFAHLDAWARKLRLGDGRPLTAAERRDEHLARRVGRPAKPESARAKRMMISMSPTLVKAAGLYAKRTGRTLSGLIAESLEEKITRKAC